MAGDMPPGVCERVRERRVRKVVAVIEREWGEAMLLCFVFGKLGDHRDYLALVNYMVVEKQVRAAAALFECELLHV